MHKRLFIPGPTETPPEILQAQTKWLIGHRSAEYTALYDSVLTQLRKFFETKQHLTVLTSSGTLWMDITARSIVKKKALAVTCGAFSNRMFSTIKDAGKDVDQLDIEWGKAAKPEDVLEALSKGDYDTVTVVANETSTGVRTPVYEIGEAIKKEYPDVMYVIDAVSSLGGDLLYPDKIKSDVIFTSTQKAFALPPGLSIGIFSEDAVTRARSVDARGHYTDLIAYHDYYLKKKQNPATPNVSLMFALDYQLGRMLEETHVGRYERHLAMADLTRKWAKKHFEMFPEPGYESVTVSTINNTLGRSIGDLNKELAKRGYQISNGYGTKLKEITFRIGHMGEWNPTEVQSLLWHIEDIWGL
ncbi:MAG TPA: alanine--glyoxylate aminotransferase family protein [Euryarchaeota archaeon]|nr:alanine--glyoxylate aminotransferase family protein [Euryarchaeota archaeon]